MGGLTDINPQLEGATDGTLIGNVGDSLKVVVGTFTGNTSFFNVWSKKLRQLDMNASNGGVARGTSITNSSWVDIFSYSGSGFFAGAIINIETFTLWRMRIVIDSQEILLDSNGILSDDIQGDTVYDMDDTSDVTQAVIGISKGSHDRFVYSPPLNFPIYYSTSISIKLKRDTGAPSKKFQAGFINLSKET